METRSPRFVTGIVIGFVASVVIMATATSASAGLIVSDEGYFTRIHNLGIDLHDVDAFRNLTHQEVIDRVDDLGDGWYFASANDVRPIFPLLTEQYYVDEFRHMIGFYSINPYGTDLYNTGGRVIDTYPTSPGFNYLWGFGNGIQRYNRELEEVEYVWSSFGIGYDMAETRFRDQGAWVIRSIPITPIPEPSTLGMAGLATVCLLGYRRLRKS